MANFNKVILAGNLTRDPQLTYLPSNTAVCEFGMAMNRKWKSPTGEMKEDVCFVDVKAFGKQAETLSQYMSKGKQLLVDGRLRYEQWEGKDGQKRSRLSVVVENFQFLGAPSGQGGGPGGSTRAPRQQPQHAAAPAGMDEPPPYDDVQPPAGEDIPF